MNEPVVRFPVVCPICRSEVLAEFPVADVAAAFLKYYPIRLVSSCHDESWTASEDERQQIREYLGAAWFEPVLESSTQPA